MTTFRARANRFLSFFAMLAAVVVALLTIFPRPSPVQLRNPAQTAHPSPADTVDAAAAAAADAEMDHMGGMDMDHDPHMYMTARRAATHSDSLRAAAIVTQMRTDLAKYKDVNVAIADGFKQFLPNIPQPVYHFTNTRWALEERFRFNPSKPTSLLYRKNGDGSFTLVGAMFTEGLRTSESDLDKRVPLGIAQWHQHVNWCMPKRGELARWSETRGGKPVFGPKSPIVTESACDAVGGQFSPHVLGWMVHANVFASDDPAVIWGHTM